MPRPKPKLAARLSAFVPDFTFTENQWRQLPRPIRTAGPRLRKRLEQAGSLYLEEKWAATVMPTAKETKAMLAQALKTCVAFEKLLLNIDGKSKQLIDIKLSRSENDFPTFHRSLKKRVQLYRRAVSEALSGQIPEGGTSSRSEERLAINIARALESFEIKPSIYDQGSWAQALKAILTTTGGKIANVRHLLTKAAKIGW